MENTLEQKSTGEAKKVAFYTLGCKLNFSETSTIARNFNNEGFDRVDFEEVADIYVINTCSVTENADKQFKQVVKKAMKLNDKAFIAAVGCYAQLKPEELAAVDGVDLVLGATEKFKITDSGKLDIKFEEVKSPDLDAYLVATNIADQLVRRIPFRRVMNQALERVKRSGAKGVRISLAGRLGGSEIARRETVKDGSIPLQTLRAQIDFAKIDAKVPRAGIVGVKVWINKGES